MRNLEECAHVFEGLLKECPVDHYAFSLSESESQELNLENGDFTLLRTVQGNGISLKLISQGRIGTSSGTDLSDEGLQWMIADARTSLESATPDPMWDIAPDQGKDSFSKGCDHLDLDRLFSRTAELKQNIEQEFPLIRLMLLIASQVSARKLYRNRNGTAFDSQYKVYSVSLEFSAGEGDKTTGIDSVGFLTDDLSIPFIEQAAVRQHLADTSRRIGATAFDGKFTGTVIFTPECLGQFISMLLGNYVSDGVILDGTSLWLDKIGERVASPVLTVSNRSSDPRIVLGESWTGDGFRTEDIVIIDHGILKTHLLSLYVSRKTGRPVTRNTDNALIIEPGEASIESIIKGTEKGILVGDFSGGSPGTNGDFSGVAKNAFLIENGRISRAVNETMISGNLGAIFTNIRAISRETVEDGATVLPYMAVDGIVVSGK